MNGEPVSREVPVKRTDQLQKYTDVGLYLSLKLTAICIVDRTGKIERQGVVASDPETIAAFVKSHAPNVAQVGLETGAHRRGYGMS